MDGIYFQKCYVFRVTSDIIPFSYQKYCTELFVDGKYPNYI